MNDTKYNGWTNYETWNVALWIDNDQGAQEMLIERAQKLLDDAAGEISGPVDVEECRHDCLSKLCDEIENYITDPDLGGMPELAASLYADLLSHALGMVDWREIAKHMLCDLEPATQTE